MRKKIIAVIAAGFIAAVGFAAPAQAVSATTAELSVFHGIPATPVDVWVNGVVTAPNFQPGTFAGPLELAPGDYSVVITAVGDPITKPVIGPAVLPLKAGTSYTVVAFLDAAAKPTAKLFTNDISKIAAGQGRVTVRHTAAAPAVDILAGGAPAFKNLVNGDEQKADLPVGTLSVAIAATGTTTPVLGPVDVANVEGTNTIVYAYGNLTGDPSTLAVAKQTIAGLHSTPGGVDAGSAGLVADPDPALITWGIAGMLVLLAAAGVAASRIVAARRSNRS